ncbi:plasma protease C1 inhibitor [Clupea harengus]|uniref:Plasma protease C1 inhibitor n=1 Tax=Clupea harengus TaxID=7950 RepID=A0A8M1KAI9_CLUHA|nr:plasma protease C1 inhibitor [Clupea harengus]
MSHSGMLCRISLLLLLEFAFTLSVEVIVPKGSDLTLTCHHGEAPKILEDTFKWTFRSRNSISQIQVGEDSKLSKQRIRKSDEGEYECVMDGYMIDGDSRMRISRTYNVSVDTSGSFKQWVVVKVTEGDVANLPCSPSTNVSLIERYVWIRKTEEGALEYLKPLFMDENDDEVKDAGVYRARPDEDFAINIHGSKVQDTGMYTCQFQEGPEERTQLVELTVEALPPPRCYGHTEPWELCEDEKRRTTGPILSESLTDFSTKLYSYLRTAKPSENLLFSPVSIAGVLSHLLLGARGETRKLMEDALALPRGFSCIHKALKTLREETQESLDMASHIFYSPDQTLSEAFINQSMEFYEATPAKLTQDSEQNVKMINDWVAEKTKHKIPKLVDSVDSFNQLILVNAVYFLGKWKLKFDGKSRPGAFTTLNGDMVNVNTLYGAKYTLSMQFSSSLRAQVGAFPLTGKNRLFILLPVTSSLKDLQAVEEKMTDTVLREVAKDMAKVTPTVAEVTLPKLKLDITTDMNRLLGDIGLGELFNAPNLCGVFPEETDMPAALSDARHRATLTLSESGVEAAAASSLSFARSFPTFTALQPFILVLWSDQANCPLFMGRVTQP